MLAAGNAEAGAHPEPYIVLQDRVEAFDTDDHYVYLCGGQRAWVLLRGDGDTDLDPKVYDMHGNLLASDLGITDRGVLEFIPPRSGIYRIEVENLGDVWNAYDLVTN